ncbi:MAG: hypothetical protein ACYTGP_10795 [Planctomycetota bacterium]|jgi:hypothetical protein
MRGTLTRAPGAILVALACAIATAQDTTPTAADADERLIIKLRTTRLDARYVREDFSEVVDDLRAQFDLNIHVAWTALSELAVRRDDQVTVELAGITLDTLLRLVTDDLATGHRVGHAVRNGVVLIAPRQELRQQTVVRTYDVTDLLESGYAHRRFTSTPLLRLTTTGRELVGGVARGPRSGFGGGGGGFGGGGAGGRGGGGGGGGGSIFGEPTFGPPPLTAMERIDQITDLLMANITPDEWVDHGGEVASLWVWNSTLFVRHTVEHHREIERFLSLIRTTQPVSLNGEVAIIRLPAERAEQWRSQLGSFPRIDDEAWAALLAAAAPDRVIFRGTTSGFNGQRLWFSALAQRTVLTRLNPVVSESVRAFTPRWDLATDGLELIVLPLLDANGETLILDVQMAWIPTTETTERPVALGSDDGNGTIDQVTRRMRTVSTATRLANDHAIVLTIPHRLDDLGRAAKHEDWLLVRVRHPNQGE